MKSKSAKPSFINETSRCQRTTRNGRCRMPAIDPSGTLCFDHASAALQDRDNADFSAALTRESSGFQTAEGINFALGDLYLLLAQGRISPRRAAALGYISSLLLRTLPAIDTDRSPRAYRPVGAAVAPRPISEPNAGSPTDTVTPAHASPQLQRPTPIPAGKTPLPDTIDGFLDAVKKAN